MKKILLSAKDLKIGGIEKSLVNLIKYLSQKKYKITLVLEEERGELLDKIPKSVKIVKYTPNKNKVIIIRKAINLFKRITFILKYRKKFDVAISFTTYLKSGSFVARMASKNSCLWCHADYLELFKGDKLKVKEFFEELHFENFSKIVFVSKTAKENFRIIFPEYKNIYYCNNLIDYKDIYRKTREPIDLKYTEKEVTFLNVGRHDERQKKLSRIIEAAYKLKKDKFNFRIIFVGSGKDTKRYKLMVKEYGLENNVIFEGEKTNPYPYFKIANAIVLSSDYEGYPVVFLESFILNKPIITTNVSDYKDVQEGRGIVVQKNTDSLYRAMKRIIIEGYNIKKEFNIIRYNEEVKENLRKTIDIF